MRWSALLGAVGLLAALGGASLAQTLPVPPGCEGPGVPVVPLPPPLVAPNCPTPTLPVPAPAPVPVPGSVTPAPSPVPSPLPPGPAAPSPIPGAPAPVPGVPSPAPSIPGTPTPSIPSAPSPAIPSAPAPSDPAPAAAATPSLTAAAPAAGSGSSGSSAPNMYGDIFGPRPIRLSLPGASIVLPPTVRTIQDFVTVVPQGGLQSGRFLGTGTQTPTGIVINQFVPVVTDGLAFFPANQARAFGQTLTPAPIFLPAGSAIATIGPNGVLVFPAPVALLENGAVSRAAAGLALPGEQVVFRQGQAFNPRVTNDPRIAAYDIQQVYDLVTPGQIIAVPDVVISIPSPSGGGIVGRTKIADDNNPLPRDRVIFGYDYFNRARVTSAGVDVHRFSPGIEKTFLDQRASVELRIPFASTINSNVLADIDTTSGGRAELGDVHLTFKALVYSTERVNVASGLGVSVPTADDINVRFANGSDLLRLRNDAWLLEPYLAVLITPDDRLFIQTWVQGTFNACGNRVEANAKLDGKMVDVGRLYDNSLIFVSAQAGYWLYRDDSGSASLSALGVFGEMHYNATLGGGNDVRFGSFVASGRQSLDELNITAGVSTLIGDNLQIMVGASAPVLQGDRHRNFDYQIGVRGNWFFGPTAASRSAAARASSF